MGRRRAFTIGSGALLGAAVLMAACGGDDSGAPTTAPGTSATATTVAATTAAPTTAATTAVPTTPAPATTVSLPADFDESAARAEVTAMWEKFFDKDSSVDERVALVEDGEALTEAITSVKTNPLIGQATATAKRVTFQSATAATVLYDILVSGAVVLGDAEGVAVKTDAGWQVSKESFCGLAGLALGVPPPGC